MKKFTFSLLALVMCVCAFAQTTAPNLQMTYPQAMSKVSQVPDQILFMFDQEITTVGGAAVQWGENEPVMVENTSVIDGNTVVLNVADIKSQITPGNVCAMVFVNNVENFYETNFTLGAEFGVESSNFTAQGGQIVFNQSVDFVPDASTTVNVVNAKTKNVATTAELSLDDDNWAAINVEFTDKITAAGNYYVEIPASTIMSVDEEHYQGGQVAFSIEESGAAVLLGVSPVEGSKVDLNTEYIVTFSAPVKYTVYMSDISVGQNPFGDEDGAIFSMNEDKTEIHAKLDTESIAAWYGATTIEDYISKFGSTVTLHLWKVKDLATGEALEYNDDEYDQFTFTFKLGDPVLSIDPADGEAISQLDMLFFSCSEGLEVADESKNILVMHNKQQVASIPASDLEAVQAGWLSDDDDDFGFGDQVTTYIYEFETPFTEDGTYEVYVPEGTFKLAGEAVNKTTIVTYTIGGSASAAYTITPEEGIVTELQNFSLYYKGQPIVASSMEGKDLTITNAFGEVVATISQDDIHPSGEYADWDADFNPIRMYFELSEAITAPGEYTLNVPAGAFYVGENYDNCEELTFSWTINAPAGAYTVVTDPADGATVDYIATILYTFEGAFTADYDSSINPTIKNEKGEDASPLVLMGWGTELNQLELITMQITATGVYTVTLPAGLAIIDNVPTTEDIVIKLYIGVTNNIEGVTVNGEAVEYNLAGQRVNGAKGIVIKNGKKTVIK